MTVATDIKQSTIKHHNQDSDEDTIAQNVEWNPTDECFERFLMRDFDLAQSNVRMVLQGSKFPMTVRSIKECLLHSGDVLERVLASKIASGHVTEDKGRYLWVQS